MRNLHNFCVIHTLRYIEAMPKEMWFLIVRFFECALNPSITFCSPIPDKLRHSLVCLLQTTASCPVKGCAWHIAPPSAPPTSPSTTRTPRSTSTLIWIRITFYILYFVFYILKYSINIKYYQVISINCILTFFFFY